MKALFALPGQTSQGSHGPANSTRSRRTRRLEPRFVPQHQPEQATQPASPSTLYPTPTRQPPNPHPHRTTSSSSTLTDHHLLSRRQDRFPLHPSILCLHQPFRSASTTTPKDDTTRRDVALSRLSRLAIDMYAPDGRRRTRDENRKRKSKSMCCERVRIRPSVLPFPSLF